MQNEMKKKRNPIKLVAILVLSLVMVLCGVMFAFSLNSNSKVIAETKNDDYSNCLTFTAEEAGSTISFRWGSASDVKTSTDGTNWSDYTAGGEITLENVGDKVMFKGLKVVTDDASHFKMTGKISASGDVTSLTNGNEATPGGAVDLSQAYPYQEAEKGCYYKMFYECASLTTAPNLPSTTLSYKCYNAMFEKCTSLTSMPDLSHVTTLANNCYNSMFAGCINLEVNILQTERTDYKYLSRLVGSSVESQALAMFYNCPKVKGTLSTETDVQNFIYNGFYLTFTAEEDNSSVTFNYTSCETGTTPQYRILNGKGEVTTAWTNCETAQTETKVELQEEGDKVQFKGKNVATSYVQDPTTKKKTYYNFYMAGKIAASGDVTSLTNYVGGDVNLAEAYSSQQIEGGCYVGMFSGCTALTTAPNLPSTNIMGRCYLEMFAGCTGLTAIPEKLLPATTLSEYCYYSMFYKCTGLTSIPQNLLPAQTMADVCYAGMFGECSNLTNTPSLPATTLAQACYYYMFYKCTSLKTLSDNLLTATTMLGQCYQSMFQGCSKLRVVDVGTTGTGFLTLPSDITSVDDCVTDMFKDCPSAPTLQAGHVYAIKNLEDITIDETAQTATYDGKTHAFVVTSKTPVTTITGFTVQYAPTDTTTWSDTAPTDAGEYDVLVTRAEDENYNKFETTISKGLVINKKELTKPTTKEGVTFTYNGESQALTHNQLDNFVSDKMEFTLVEGTNVGTYSSQVAISNPNYCFKDGEGKEVTSITISWTINKAEDNAITLGEGTTSKTYDGQKIELKTATAKYGQDTMQTTITKNGATFEGDIVDVGTYVVTYKVEGTDNYNKAEISYTITINKAQAVITTEQKDVTKTFDNQVVTPADATSNFGTVTKTVTKAQTNEDVEIKNVGKYTITYTVEDDPNGNWKGATVSFTVTINKGQAVITVEGGLGDETKTYDEQIVNPRNSTSNFGTVIRTISKSVMTNQEVEMKDAGEYIVNYKVEGTENFNGTTAEYKVIINQKEIETTIETTSKGVVVKGTDGAVIPAKVYYALHKAEHELEDWQEDVPTAVGEYDIQIVLEDGNTKAKTDYIEKGYTVASSGCNGLSWWAIMLICFGVAGIGAGAYFFIIKRRKHDKEAGDR